MASALSSSMLHGRHRQRALCRQRLCKSSALRGDHVPRTAAFSISRMPICSARCIATAPFFSGRDHLCQLPSLQAYRWYALSWRYVPRPREARWSATVVAQDLWITCSARCRPFFGNTEGCPHGRRIGFCSTPSRWPPRSRRSSGSSAGGRRLSVPLDHVLYYRAPAGMRLFLAHLVPGERPILSTAPSRVVVQTADISSSS